MQGRLLTLLSSLYKHLLKEKIQILKPRANKPTVIFKCSRLTLEGSSEMV